MFEQIKSIEAADGGPAFPTVGDFWDTDSRSYRIHAETNGMTLRDYFAAKALSGMLNDQADNWSSSVVTKVGKRAYEFADAMLKAR